MEVSGRLLRDLPVESSGVTSAEGELSSQVQICKGTSAEQCLILSSPCCHCLTLWVPMVAAGWGEESCQTLLSFSRVLRALPACPCGCERPGPYYVPALHYTKEAVNRFLTVQVGLLPLGFWANRVSPLKNGFSAMRRSLKCLSSPDRNRLFPLKQMTEFPA